METSVAEYDFLLAPQASCKKKIVQGKIKES